MAWTGALETELNSFTQSYADAEEAPELKAQCNILYEGYCKLEGVLIRILECFGIHDIDGQRRSDGTHSYHENLIKKFAEASTPSDLRDCLGRVDIQAKLKTYKTFRNEYKEWCTHGNWRDDVPSFLVSVHREAMSAMPDILRAVQAAKIKADAAADAAANATYYGHTDESV